MLSIGAMAAGQSDYYLNLAREDYYLAGGEPEGRWLGKGAQALGLSGSVAKEDLARLFRGYSPTGRPLVQNAGKRNRVPGWDLSFSVPKSLSVIWSQLDETRQRVIQSAHHEAVVAAIDYLEQHHAYSRIGKRGAERIRVQLIAALFEHSFSRALDPQLHTHALLLNLGVDGDGVVRSTVSREYFKHKMLAGALYRCQLAKLLQERLGLEVVRPAKASWFEVKGVPQKLMAHFSKRREEILNELKGRGLDSAAAAAFAALTTREPKSLAPPRKELHARWREEGCQFGFNAKLLLGRSQPSLAAEDVESRFKKVLAEAVSVLTSNRNCFTQSALIRTALEIAQEHCLSAEKVVTGIAEDLTLSRDRFVSLGMRNGQETLWTTTEVLQLEREFFQNVAKLKERSFRPVSSSAIERVLRQSSGKGRFLLDSEQQQAVRHIVAGKGAIKCLVGLAGTGKTRTLAAAREALEKAGYRVIGAALAGVAARTLQESAGIESITVRAAIHRLYPKTGCVLKHHAAQLWRAARKKRTFALPKLIDSKTVLILDEASMVGVRDFGLLVKAVVEQGGSLVVVGDHRQLSAIERPGAFEYLLKELGCAELTNIRRQEDRADRDAVRSIVSGDPESALRHYAEKGHLIIASDKSQIEETLVAEWQRSGGAEQPAKHRIFAATRAEVKRLNELCQRERVRAGAVDASQRVDHEGQCFMVGDRIRFNSNARLLGIRKGERGVVLAVKEGLIGKYVAVALDADKATFSERFIDAVKHHARQVLKEAIGRHAEKLSRRGEIVVVPLATLNPLAAPYDGLVLDYASTGHLGQGQTVAHSHVLLGGGMTSRELSYVLLSRHQTSLRLYTTEEHAGIELAELARTYRPLSQAPSQRVEDPITRSPLIEQMKRSVSEPLAAGYFEKLEFPRLPQNQERRHELSP